MPELGPGSELAGCRLERIAGRGGMGVVWRATQIALNRPVALKAIAPGLAQDESFRERFQRESLLAASIDHPNVIPVYEAGELDGTLYLIMRWVDGTDLRARLTAEGRMRPATAIRLLRPVASALAAAHRRGLIHRDVKPANVLITAADDAAEEHVYLTDFGIARRNDSRGMTRTGVLIGTLDYIAPEMIQGGRGTQSSDIYAFGCMLFESLTGQVPFSRPTEIAKMHAHINDPVPVEGLPAAMVPIVTRAMAKRPEDRFGSAAELVAALDLVHDSTTAPPTAPTDLPTELSTVPEPDPGATRLAPEPEPDPGATRLAPASDDAATRLGPAQLNTPVAPPPAQPRTPPPSGGSSRRVGVLIGLLVLVVAIVAVIVATSGGGGGSSSSASSGSTAGGGSASVSARVVSGSGIKVLSAATLPDPPLALAPDNADVWAATRKQLFQISAAGSTQTLHQQVSPGAATGLGIDSQGRVWVGGAGGTELAVPAGHNVVATASGSNLLALDPQAGWVASRGKSNVARVDLRSLVGASAPVAGPLAAYTASLGRLWVAASDGHVTVLDGDGTRDPLPAPNVGPGTVAVASSNGIFFVNSDGTFHRIDPRKAINGVPVGSQYLEHAVPAVINGGVSTAGAWPGTDAIWVLSPSTKSLFRVGTHGPDDGKISAKITFSAEPGQLAVGDHIVWVGFPSAKAVIPITY